MDAVKSPPLFTRSALTKLIIPLIAEQFLLICVGMADTMMVATCGEAAVSGISLVDQINNLLIQLFAALAAGGSVVAAQYIGKRDPLSAGASAKQLIYASTGIALVVGIIAVGFNGPIIDLIYGTLEEAVRTNAVTYFYITAVSFPFLALYNAGAALMRAKGNSRISLLLSILMNVINIVGNAILIFGAGWGVAGAAIATLISRIVAAVVITWLLTKPDPHLYIQDLFSYRPDMTQIKTILKVGIPGGIENSMFHLGRLMVAGLVSTFGTAAIAANAVCGNICGIPAIPGSAIGLALITVVGQCIGAGETKQAEAYTKKLVALCYGCLLVMNGLLVLLSPTLVALYNVSEEASVLAIQINQIFALASILVWSPSFALPNAMRAAGDVKFAMTVSMISMWVMRVAASYVLAYFGWGLHGVWIGMYLDWILRAVLFTIRFLGGKWKTFKVV